MIIAIILSYLTYFQTSEDVAFEFYRKHIDKNGAEPNLPGFLLNNKQMFWVALQNKKCQKGNIDYSFSTIFSKFGLAEAFNCLKKNNPAIE